MATIASMHPLVDDVYRRELGLRIDRTLFRWAVRHPAWARTLITVGSRAPKRMIMSDVIKSAVAAELPAIRAHSQTILAFINESTLSGAHGVVDDYSRLAVDWGFDLSTVIAHTTVWHGSDDPLVPASHGRDLARLIPTASFEELPAKGHYLPFTDGTRIIAGLMPC